MGLGETLRGLRVAAGLTQEELAEHSGLSVRAISDIERGRSRRPYRSTLRQLVDALDLADDVADQLLRSARTPPPTATPTAISTPTVTPTSTPTVTPTPTSRSGSAAVAPEPGPSTVPHQLPLMTARLRGRTRELEHLDRWRESAENDGPRLVAMVGAGGAGKTSLAIQWARRSRDRFPDGELYVNLRGFDQADAPLDAMTALDVLLRALGIDPAAIPGDEAARAAFYRSVLGERRLIILLDNARDTGQVRPLLAGPACLTIVTSRNQLRGLVARDGAHRITVGRLDTDATLAVLRDVTAGSVPVDRAQAGELAERCAGLPLTVRIVAERAVREGIELTESLAQLGNRDSALDALDSGDGDETNVRSVLSWSYQALPPDTARAFRLLGAGPVADLGPAAAAALLGVSETAAGRLLDRLLGAHLLEQPRPDRYQLHDVLRSYAAELPRTGDDDPALLRLLDWYRTTAAAARHQLYPLTDNAELHPARFTVPATEFTDAEAALAWFGAETASMVSLIDHAAEHGLERYATDLAWLLWYFFDLHKMWDLWSTTHQVGLAAARRTGDRRGEARMLNGLGIVHADRGRFDDAVRFFQDEIDIATELADENLEGNVAQNLGAIYSIAGRKSEALEYTIRSLRIAEKVGTTNGQIRSLANVGEILNSMGRHSEAVEYLRHGRELARKVADRRGELFVASNLGVAYTGMGRYDEALVSLGLSLAGNRELGLRNWEAFSLLHLGDCLVAQGDPDAAREHWTQALQIFTELGAPERDTVRGRLETLPVLRGDTTSS